MMPRELRSGSSSLRDRLVEAHRFGWSGVQAQETRHKFYDMAAAEKALVAGYHFSFPSVGHVEKDGAGYRLVPAPWNPSI